MTMTYLDHAATTPMRPEVRDAMLAWFGPPANPSSAHTFGRQAAAAVEAARHEVAAFVGVDPRQVLFVASATEGNHYVLRGLAKPGAHVLVTAAPHASVEGVLEVLAPSGVTHARIGLSALARDVEPEGFEGAADVVSVLAAHPESGVIAPWRAWVDWAHAHGATVHVDATAAAGSLDLQGAGADGLVFSAHKLGGPVGVAAVVLKDKNGFSPLFPGTAERGRRGGTPAVAAIVGFAAAVACVRREHDAAEATVRLRQQRLEREIRALGGRIVGQEAPRMASHTLCVFEGIEGEDLVAALDLAGIAASVGSACASGSGRPSPLLLALHDPWPSGALRLTQGWSTQEADIDAAIAALHRIIPQMREVLGA